MSTKAVRASLFITLFIFERDNNNKNNRLDLNGSKENINILLLYCIFDSWTASQSQETSVDCICTAVFEVVFLPGKMKPVYESMRKYKRLHTALPFFFEWWKAFVIVFT